LILLQHQTSNIKHQSEEMGFGAIVIVALLGLAPVARAGRKCIHCQEDEIDLVAILKGELKDPCAHYNPNHESKVFSIVDCGDKPCRSAVYFGVTKEGEKWQAAERNCYWPRSAKWVSLPEESQRRNMICEEHSDGRKMCYRSCDTDLCNSKPLEWTPAVDKNQKMALDAEF